MLSCLINLIYYRTNWLLSAVAGTYCRSLGVLRTSACDLPTISTILYSISGNV